MDKKHIILIVDNQPGILARISSVFAQRGFNMDSLAIAKLGTDESVSKINIETHGDANTFSQIKKHLGKLIEVREIIVPDDGKSSLFELMAVRFRQSESLPALISSLPESVERTVSIEPDGDEVVVLCGLPELLDAFLMSASGEAIVDSSRTGVIAI